MNMNRLLLMLAVAATAGILLLSNPTSAQFIPSARKTAHVRIIKGPELELARENLTIITWTSHIRLNQTHRYTIFRVRVEGLAPKTTYYYTVDSVDARGASDRVNSSIKTFTTQ